MGPFWHKDGVTLYQGDCRSVITEIQADAVLTDPPYGGDFDTNYSRFKGGIFDSRNDHKSIRGDDEPFDPSPFLKFRKAILFGFQFYADKLPLGTTLVWVKKRESQLGHFCSDAELAWMKGGHGVYVFNHTWNGFDRATERGKTLHPTQKPVALFEWCIDKLKLKPGQTVFDPYMGSGPSGIACVRKGINYIGCEIESDYFGIAKQRIENEIAAIAA